MLVMYFDSIQMFLAGALALYLGMGAERIGIGDKLAPAPRALIVKTLRIGGPVLMVGAVVMAIFKTLLSG